MTKKLRLWLTMSIPGFVAVGLLTACGPSSDSPAGLVRTLGGHTLRVTSVDWSSDGKLLAAGSDDTTVLIWDANTGQTVTRLPYGGSVLSVAWSPDGKYLAVGFAAKNSVRVTETASWKTLYEWDTDARSQVSSVAWSLDSRKLAVSSAPPNGDGTLDIWDMSANKTIARLIKTGGADHAKWSPDSKVLAFISVLLVPGIPKGTVEIWDPSKGDGQSSEKNTTRIATEGDLVPTVTWSPDGKQIASGSFDHLVKIWDVASKQNTITFSGHTESVESVDWSPNGEKIASGSWDRTARIWDVSSGNEIAKFTHPDYVNSVAWSPDGKYLATGDQENFNNVRIWEVK